MALKRSVRNGHRAFTKRASGRKNQIIRDWLLWAFKELASGRKVELYGIGVLYLKWRNGRVLVQKGAPMAHGMERMVQPDTWTLKVYASVPLRKALVKLAAQTGPPAVIKKKPSPIAALKEQLRKEMENGTGSAS